LARLRQSPYAPVRETWCEFNEGVLILRGDVRSFFHKQVAQQSVAGMPGVVRVDNQIHVSAGKPVSVPRAI
jgi:osmotically-inducible protein OsmY